MKGEKEREPVPEGDTSFSKLVSNQIHSCASGMQGQEKIKNVKATLSESSQARTFLHDFSLELNHYPSLAPQTDVGVVVKTTRGEATEDKQPSAKKMSKFKRTLERRILFIFQNLCNHAGAEKI